VGHLCHSQRVATLLFCVDSPKVRAELGGHEDTEKSIGSIKRRKHPRLASCTPRYTFVGTPDVTRRQLGSTVMPKAADVAAARADQHKFLTISDREIGEQVTGAIYWPKSSRQAQDA
jgi:hypothetical protein